MTDASAVCRQAPVSPASVPAARRRAGKAVTATANKIMITA